MINLLQTDAAVLLREVTTAAAQPLYPPSGISYARVACSFYFIFFTFCSISVSVDDADDEDDNFYAGRDH